MMADYLTKSSSSYPYTHTHTHRHTHTQSDVFSIQTHTHTHTHTHTYNVEITGRLKLALVEVPGREAVLTEFPTRHVLTNTHRIMS